MFVLVFKNFGKFLYCVKRTKTVVADANKHETESNKYETDANKYERDTKNKTSEDIVMTVNKKIDNEGYCIVESKDKSETLYPV